MNRNTFKFEFLLITYILLNKGSFYSNCTWTQPESTFQVIDLKNFQKRNSSLTGIVRINPDI